MSTANSYNRKKIDYRVWLVMLSIWFICLALFGYKQIKYSRSNRQPCTTENITVNSKDGGSIPICDLNRIATFRIETDAASKVEWDFGDGMKGMSGSVAWHKFKSEGIYKVVATVNGLCKYVREISVENPIFINPEQAVLKIYADSAKASVGNQVRFSGVANFPVETYEWTLLETGEVQNGETVAFTFNREGKYNVQLVVNNDPSKTTSETIEIVAIPQPNSIPGFPSGADMGNPGPLFPSMDVKGQNAADQNSNGGKVTANPETEAAKPKATEIDPETFKGLLQTVLDGDKEIEELFPYLDYKGSTKVEVNGKSPWMNINAFCKEKAKKKIESLQFGRDNNNSIQIIQVKLKARKILGIIPRKN